MPPLPRRPMISYGPSCSPASRGTVRVRISDGAAERWGDGAKADRLSVMDIWLLRHAAAEDRSGSGRDADRELTSEGRKRAERVAKGLAALEPGIEAVWTS